MGLYRYRSHIALSIVCEIKDFARFNKAREFSSFIGLCARELSCFIKFKKLSASGALKRLSLKDL